MFANRQLRIFLAAIAAICGSAAPAASLYVLERSRLRNTQVANYRSSHSDFIQTAALQSDQNGPPCALDNNRKTFRPEPKIGNRRQSRARILA